MSVKGIVRANISIKQNKVIQEFLLLKANKTLTKAERRRDF